MGNDVKQWYYAYIRRTNGTLFGEAARRHIAFNHGENRIDREYDRDVLHISAVPCRTRDPETGVQNIPMEFRYTQVFCTDGKTIGHHFPGECPFEVKPNR